jgi:hypothetical protein
MSSTGATAIAAVNHAAIRALMSAMHRSAQDQRATPAATPEEFYGFTAEDVVHVHLYKQGVGKGVWFRLKDCRVVDVVGQPSQPESHWYEEHAH